jgi:hypothetical protein
MMPIDPRMSAPLPHQTWNVSVVQLTELSEEERALA